MKANVCLNNLGILTFQLILTEDQMTSRDVPGSTQHLFQ